MRYNILIALFQVLMISSCAQNQGTVSESDEASSRTISPAEYSKDLKGNVEIILLDVRTPEEYNSGTIGKAKNIDYLADDFATKVEKLDKSRPIYVFCKVGGRSAGAQEKLISMGFKDVTNLDGGIMAWKQAGLTVSNKSNKIIEDEMNLETYQKTIQNATLVLVDFYAPWCKPCQRMKPHIEKLAKDYEGKLTVLQLDYDKSPHLAESIGVIALPTIIVYKNGEKTYHKAEELDYIKLENLIK